MNQELNSAIRFVAAIGQAIKELGSVPSGHLYAQLMGRMTLSQYQNILSLLERSGLIKIGNDHLIKWIGE
jgi:hypothetical protein